MAQETYLLFPNAKNPLNQDVKSKSLHKQPILAPKMLICLVPLSVSHCAVPSCDHHLFDFRSHEQQHYFNTPFQLSLPPTELQSQVLADRPESADQYEFSVEDGDVILLATDGLFDNVPDR